MKIDIALIALLALASAAAAGDREPDPMHSPQCEAARAELDTLVAQPRASRERLEQARRRVAQACLGASDTVRQRSGAPEPPQVVAPTIGVQRQPVAPSAIEPAPAPLAIPRPTAITTCDAAGCWDSDGRRLNRMGPLLVGPGGVCHGLGAIVNCP